MALQPETRFKLKVKEELNNLPKTWHFKTQLAAVVGIPDIIGVSKGKFFALELKVDNNHPSKIQSYVLDKIKEAGGIAAEIRPENFEHFISQLKALP